MLKMQWALWVMFGTFSIWMLEVQTQQAQVEWRMQVELWWNWISLQYNLHLQWHTWEYLQALLWFLLHNRLSELSPSTLSN